jgi:hypothetical protein
MKCERPLNVARQNKRNNVAETCKASLGRRSAQVVCDRTLDTCLHTYTYTESKPCTGALEQLGPKARLSSDASVLHLPSSMTNYRKVTRVDYQRVGVDGREKPCLKCKQGSLVTSEHVAHKHSCARLEGLVLPAPAFPSTCIHASTVNQTRSWTLRSNQSKAQRRPAVVIKTKMSLG